MARWLPVALAFLCACSMVLDGDEHTGNPAPDMGPGGPQPLDPADACNRFADVMCRGALSCCGSVPADCAADEEACLSACKNGYQITCLESLGAWIADPMAGYDRTIAGEVLFELQTRAATCDLSIPEVFAVGLFEIAQGSLAAGDSGCDPVESIGSIDFTKASYCAGDLDCLSEGGALGTWTCGERRSEGEPCTTYLECERDLGCGPTNVCGPREANGSSCFLAGDCESFVCERDMAEINGTCVAATEANVYCALLDPPGR